jgi:heptosyltransferase III
MPQATSYNMSLSTPDRRPYATIFHQAALGDFVLLLPVMRSLSLAGWSLRVVAPRQKAELARSFVEDVQAIDIDTRRFTLLHGPWRGEVDDHSAVDPDLRSLLTGSDILISFVSDGSDNWARNVRAIVPGKRIFFVKPRPQEHGEHAWTSHITQWHRWQLSAQGLSLSQPPAPDARVNIAGPIVIHPGSGGENKRWPIERFEALLDTAIDRNRSVCVVLGEVERERWRPDLLKKWLDRYPIKMPESLAQLTAALADARLFIGNDSGPTHLAAPMGLPTLALFGPSSPTLWAPRGPLVTVLAPPQPCDMNWLDVETVLLASGL